jgi:protein-disulfide isomerase
MIAASGVMMYASLRRPPLPPPPPTRTLALPSEPLSLAGAPRKGSPTAPIVLLEYADFQCPVCERFSTEVLPSFAREFVETGEVQIAFRHLPLEGIHPLALAAAEAAECAHRQGRFWEMHDLLFERQGQLDATKFHDWASELGVDRVKFLACLDEPAQERVRHDAGEAREMGVKGTPTFLIGTLEPDGRVTFRDSIVGLPTLSRLRKSIEAASSASSK